MYGMMIPRLTNESQYEPACHNLAVVVNLASESGDKTPSNNEEAEIQGRASNVVQQSVGWDLHQDLTYG